jgi:hypothetical protein
VQLVVVGFDKTLIVLIRDLVEKNKFISNTFLIEPNKVFISNKNVLEINLFFSTKSLISNIRVLSNPTTTN